MLLSLMLIQLANSMSIQSNKAKSYFLDSSGAESDVVDLIASKNYFPNEKYLPKTSVVKSSDNEVTYILSKLNDEELIKLLNEQPKKTEYDISDIVNLAIGSKNSQSNKLKIKDFREEVKSTNQQNEIQSNLKKRFHTVSGKDHSQVAFFRLENKQVDPYNIKTDNSNYNAVQKLSNILYSRPAEVDKDDKSIDDDEKKELLFDVLVSQLKTLCCKRKTDRHITKKYETINEFIPYTSQAGQNPSYRIKTNEHMFLIINDEIKTNTSDELISVDPESLGRNSSVLLLGPITTPLTDSQLKLVMNRISNELSKQEYLPLLYQLSSGTLTGENIKLMKSLVTGPQTRRYIKPHRCNHQSKLARIYAGPKWLICTGYLNLNKPSLYD